MDFCYRCLFRTLKLCAFLVIVTSSLTTPSCFITAPRREWLAVYSLARIGRKLVQQTSIHVQVKVVYLKYDVVLIYLKVYTCLIYCSEYWRCF